MGIKGKGNSFPAAVHPKFIMGKEREKGKGERKGEEKEGIRERADALGDVAGNVWQVFPWGRSWLRAWIRGWTKAETPGSSSQLCSQAAEHAFPNNWCSFTFYFHLPCVHPSGRGWFRWLQPWLGLERFLLFGGIRFPNTNSSSWRDLR